jgi:hypothetical protein
MDIRFATSRVTEPRRSFSARSSWLGLVALLAAACGHHVPVETAAAPNAHVVRLRNFTVLQPEGVANAKASGDAIVRHPGALHTVSFELLLAFQARGYFADSAAPDFAVAYYVGERLPVDTAVFKYSYSFAPYTWWHDEPAVAQPTRPGSQGFLIVDVINPKTKALLWRGEGVILFPEKPSEYAEALQITADAIAGRFQAGLGSGAVAPRPLNHGGRPTQ